MLGVLWGARAEVDATAWPRTAIDTAAIKVITGPLTRKPCRSVDIMADAAPSSPTTLLRSIPHPTPKPASSRGRFLSAQEY